jgi:hypothetical protein
MAMESGEAAGIVVAKLDRLSRSLKTSPTASRGAQGGRWRLVPLDLGVDLSAALGELMANVLASPAQWKRRIFGPGDETGSRRAPRWPECAPGRCRAPDRQFLPGRAGISVRYRGGARSGVQLPFRHASPRAPARPQRELVMEGGRRQ